MILNDLCKRTVPYTQDEFMEALVGTCSSDQMPSYWEIVVVMPGGDEIRFSDHEKAISFLFDKISVFDYHVGNFAFSEFYKFLYIALFKNCK
jgi:hypothetical protein